MVVVAAGAAEAEAPLVEGALPLPAAAAAGGFWCEEPKLASWAMLESPEDVQFLSTLNGKEETWSHR